MSETRWFVVYRDWTSETLHAVIHCDGDKLLWPAYATKPIYVERIPESFWDVPIAILIDMYGAYVAERNAKLEPQFIPAPEDPAP